MALVIPQRWDLNQTRVYKNGAVSVSDTSGYKNDTILDDRKPLTRTPKGTWRPPTSYWRQIDTGNVYTYHCNATCATYLTDGSVQTFTHVGSMNTSGYYYDAPLAVPGRLENAAIIKARLKLKDQDINLAQAFGERKQTASLVSSSLKSILGTVRALKRGDLHAAQKALGLRQSGNNSRLRPEAAFDRWLELQYGWKPLLGDVEGASKRLWGIEREADRLTARCKAASQDSQHLSKVGRDSVGNCYMDYTKYRKVSYKAFVRLDFIRANNTQVANFSELGITNPLSLAWELLPFSFVFDWFIPVGDYLSSLDATTGWLFKGGSCTTVMREKGHVVLKGFPYRPYTWGQKDSGVLNGKYQRVRMNRKVYTSAPIPSVPSLDTGKSFLHVANGIALLGSAFAGNLKVK